MTPLVNNEQPRGSADGRQILVDERIVANNNVSLLNVMFLISINTVLEKTAIVGFCWLVVFCYPRMLMAADWSIQSFLDLEIGYDDNPALATDPVPSYQTSVTPLVRARRNTEASKIALDLLLNRTNYSSGEFNDTNAEILNFRSDFRTTERTTWTLDGRYKHDNVFQTTELPGTLPPDTDVGLVQTSVPRNSLWLRPEWARRLSERDTLRLSYYGEEVRYSNAAGTDLQNYTTQLLSANFSRTVKPTYELEITGLAGRYTNLDTRDETDTASIYFGGSHNFSETVSGSIQVGYRSTDVTAGTEQGRDSGYVFLARLQDKSELARFDGYIRHGLTPSGLGQTTQTTQFRMRWRKKIRPRLDFLLRTNIFRTEALGGGSSSADRRYASINSGLSWRWRPRWYLTGRYSYRYSKYDNRPEATSSNALFLDITYAFFGKPAFY